jgi:hypothetical protein
MKKSKNTGKFLLLYAVLMGLFVIGCSQATGTSDTTPPTVTAVAPADAATNVGINSSVVATFSEAMSSATIVAANFTVTANGGAAVAGTVTYIDASMAATFKPTANLAVSTKYTATITTGAKDAAGNALTAAKVWTFTTGAAADTTPPTVTLTVPADTLTGVVLNSAISATFSEAIDPATISGNFTIWPVLTGTSSYDAANNKAIFTPNNEAAGTPYTVTIGTGVKDLAGNALAANKVWSFTTAAAATAPTVSSTSPTQYGDLSGGTTVNATFSKAMLATSLTSTGTTGTFTLTGPGTTAVSGTVTYSGLVATFTPASSLTATTIYTATISTAATDSAGTPLAVAKVWTFYGGTLWPAPSAVALGGAGNYVILANTGISFASPADLVNGAIGIGPGYTSSAITGVNIKAYTAGDAFETDLGMPIQVTGNIYAPDYVGGTTPADLNTASTNMGAAITDGNSRTANALNLGATGDIGGLTFTRGVYSWTSGGVSMSNDVTLWGSATDVFIFQVTGALTMASAKHVVLSGAVLPQNVFWVVTGPTIGVSIGTTAQFNGIVLATTAVNLGVGATMNGRLYAQTAVNLKGSNIVTKAP